MSDYILAKQISPLRAALPLLQGQPMWQPGDIEMIVGKCCIKSKILGAKLYSDEPVCHDLLETGWKKSRRLSLQIKKPRPTYPGCNSLGEDVHGAIAV